MGGVDLNTVRELLGDSDYALTLRQAELAAAAGVGIRFIVDLQAGKPTLQLEKILHVLTTLGCELIIVPPAGNP